METVLLVIHLMIAVALIAVVLLQRSEGGALGIGGGGGGGFMSARGAGDLLTRTTAILAGMFFIVSIALTIVARQEVEAPSILDSVNDDPLAIPLDVDEDEMTPATDPAVVPEAESPQTPSVPVE